MNGRIKQAAKMISYFDTSVLFAAVTPSHELHTLAQEALKRAQLAGTVASTTLHTYAELYNNLTRPRPSKLHLPPEIAYQLIVEQLGSKLMLIEMNREDYELSLKRCADLKLVSGVIYDSLHVQAALKAKASVLYTDNLRDFTRLVTEGDPLEVRGVRSR